MFKLVVLSALLAFAVAAAVDQPSAPSDQPSAPSDQPSARSSGGQETIVSYHPLPLLKGAIIAAQPSHIAVAEHSLEKVGDYVESVPTAVSHQSSTIVHNRANVVRPIVAPVVRTHLAPIVHSTYGAPVVHTYAAAAAYPGAHPLTAYYGAPYYVHGYAHDQLYKRLD